MHTPPPPDTGQPSGTPAPFTHTPRSAWGGIAGNGDAQYCYGASVGAAFTGIYAHGHYSKVTLRRIGDETHAELRVHIIHMKAAAEALILLSAPALRELARCLIDAAHDIDGGQP